MVKRLKSARNYIVIGALVVVCFVGALEAETVAREGLRLRDTPSLDGKVLKHLKEGDHVTVLHRSSAIITVDEIRSSWARVTTDDSTGGWLFGGYLQRNFEDITNDILTDFWHPLPSSLKDEISALRPVSKQLLMKNLLGTISRLTEADTSEEPGEQFKNPRIADEAMDLLDGKNNISILLSCEKSHYGAFIRVYIKGLGASAIPPLFQEIEKGKDPKARAAAIQLVYDIDPQMIGRIRTTLLATVSEDSDEVASSALLVLVMESKKDGQGDSDLVNLLKSDNPRTRLRTARALCIDSSKLSEIRILEELTRLLEDNNSEVQVAAAYPLMPTWDQASLLSWLDHFQKNTPKNTPGRERLRLTYNAFVNSEKPDIAWIAFNQMSMTQNWTEDVRVTQAISSPNPRVRERIALDIANKRTTAYANEIATLWSDGDRMTRAAAAYALRQMMSPEADQILETFHNKLRAKQGAGNGIIEGSLIYPSDYVPPQFVCAENTVNEKITCTEQKTSEPFRLNLPAGRYRVFACLERTSERVYYTEFVRGGMRNKSPKAHKPVVVEVFNGETTIGVDPHDWYTDLGE